MKRGLTGSYRTISTVGGEICRAFIPNPLPPNPPIEFDAALHELYEKALLAVGALNSLSQLLPDPDLFIYNYIRKEALLSSQIEGTQSSLDELLLYERSQDKGAPFDDVAEVVNYLRAMNHGVRRLRDDAFPLSLRLIREMHRELLSKGRGSERDPGEFRKSQNWIGGERPGNSVFIPPPHDSVVELMGKLENYLHDIPVKTPALIKAAMAHVQFETIHPFLDGNGRMGRLLIALVMFTEGALIQPILYLSLYFKTHRQEYYDLLQTVRLDGDWEAWLKFFLKGVGETSEQAVKTTRRLSALFEEDRKKIRDGLKRASHSALTVHYELQKNPIVSIPETARNTGLSVPSVSSIMRKLVALNIVAEVKQTKGKRYFSYTRYMQILSEGTEPIKP